MLAAFDDLATATGDEELGGAEPHLTFQVAIRSAGERTRIKRLVGEGPVVQVRERLLPTDRGTEGVEHEFIVVGEHGHLPRTVRIDGADGG